MAVRHRRVSPGLVLLLTHGQHEPSSAHFHDRSAFAAMSHYRLALYLTSAVALLEALLVASISSFDVALARSASVRPFVAVVIVFGLWVQSKIARYLGVAWYVLMIVSVVWALPSARVWSVTLALFLVVKPATAGRRRHPVALEGIRPGIR